MNKHQSKKSLLPHWDGAVYSKYAAFSYEMVTRLSGWKAKLSKHALDSLEPCKTLDVGCGTGYLMNIANRKGFNITGIDPSQGMLKKAQEKYHFHSQQLVLSTANEMPFDDGEFDLIIASGSLVHVPNIDEAVVEIMRVLKTGGHLRIIDHAIPVEKNIFTPLVFFFSQASGDILHDYEGYFSKGCSMISTKTIGRAGYMQMFDFVKNV